MPGSQVEPIVLPRGEALPLPITAAPILLIPRAGQKPLSLHEGNILSPETAVERWNTPVMLAPIPRRILDPMPDPGEAEVVDEEEEKAEGDAGREESPEQEPGKLRRNLRRILRRFNPAGKPAFTPKKPYEFSLERASRWGEEEHHKASRWVLGAALVLIASAVFFLPRWLINTEDVSPTTVADSPVSEVAGVEAAKLAISRFFVATSIEDMAKEVRHPATTIPRMRHWYGSATRTPQTVEFTQDWIEYGGLTKYGSIHLKTSAILDGMGLSPVFLEQTPDGSFKIDWEHMVQYSDTPWAAFLDNPDAEPAEFRVTASLIDHYMGPYSDKSRYLAFRLADARNTASCTGYAAVNTPAAEALLSAVKGAGEESLDPVTRKGRAEARLRLRFEEGGKRFNLVVIDSLIRPDWLEP